MPHRLSLLVFLAGLAATVAISWQAGSLHSSESLTMHRNSPPPCSPSAPSVACWLSASSAGASGRLAPPTQPSHCITAPLPSQLRIHASSGSYSTSSPTARSTNIAFPPSTSPPSTASPRNPSSSPTSFPRPQDRVRHSLAHVRRPRRRHARLLRRPPVISAQSCPTPLAVLRPPSNRLSGCTRPRLQHRHLRLVQPLLPPHVPGPRPLLLDQPPPSRGGISAHQSLIANIARTLQYSRRFGPALHLLAPAGCHSGRSRSPVPYPGLQRHSSPHPTPCSTTARSIFSSCTCQSPIHTASTTAAPISSPPAHPPTSTTSPSPTPTSPTFVPNSNNAANGTPPPSSSWETTPGAPRPLWSWTSAWTPEEQDASDGGQFDDRPAYILKLPHQQQPAHIDTPYPAIRTRALIDALMDQRIQSPQDLEDWVANPSSPPADSTAQ